MPHDELPDEQWKSAPDIHRILTSIQNVNRRRRARRAERDIANPRCPCYYRETLLRCGRFTGGFIGTLLGLNLGLMLQIIIGNGAFSVLLPITTSLCGCAAGIVVARREIRERRQDLFNAHSPAI